MWTCPVCNRKNVSDCCPDCGFDHSTDFEHFATLQRIPTPSPAISGLQQEYRDKQTPANCPCCGSAMTGNHCLYCHFEPLPNVAPEAVPHQAVQHIWKVVGDLTDFSIETYRYAWVPERSRLEQTSKEIVPLGDARDFFGSISWTEDKFAQLRSGAGTELHLTISYQYKNNRKQLSCAIPTVKCDNFWGVGISLDTTLRLKLHLGSGNKIAASAPMALDLT